jgi:hypothetical protein
MRLASRQEAATRFAVDTLEAAMLYAAFFQPQMIGLVRLMWAAAIPSAATPCQNAVPKAADQETSRSMTAEAIPRTLAADSKVYRQPPFSLNLEKPYRRPALILRHFHREAGTKALASGLHAECRVA